jgi:ribosomal protein L33
MPFLRFVSDACPACGSDFYSRSHRRGLVERYILRALHLRPFRCLGCDSRFYRRETSENRRKHPPDVPKALFN